jgi:hypothetical protein
LCYAVVDTTVSVSSVCDSAMSFEVLTKLEARRAKISRAMLDKQIRSGNGPAVTIIGSAVRVRSDALEAWLERCTVPQHDQASGLMRP